MPEMIKPSFEKMAFMGEKAADSRFVNRVDITKDKLNVVLNPIDPVAERKINGQASGIVKGLAEGGEWSCDSVKTLVETVSDPTRSANRNVAKDRLDVLANSMYIVMTHGDNEVLRLAVGTKDGATIDAALPDSLKGIGGMVSEIAIEQEITNPKLREALKKLDRRAEVLRASGTIGEEKLRELVGGKILELSDLVEELDDRGYEELTRVSAYLGVEADKMAERVNERRGEDRMEIPPDKEGQLVIVRQLLEKVENSQRTTRDIYQGQFSAQLEEIIVMPEIHPEVAIEVRSRLKLHDCSVLMKKSNGYVEQPRSGGDPECPTVGMAATLAEGLNHALDNESISFFLKSDTNGFPVSEAWDYYQDVNIKYREILKKIEKSPRELTDGLKSAVDNDPDLGSIDANYFTDGNFNRKKRVDEYVVGELMKRKKVDRITAEKAWSMAKKLAIATGENSIFNAALSGNDEMAEDIYLKIYRQGRDEKGRPRGPQIHVDKIVGIGNSFLRQVSNVDPADSTGVIPLYSKDVVAEPVYLSNGKKEGIEEGAYVYHFGILWSAKIHPLRSLLLKRDPDPRETIGIDVLQTAQDYFKKADPDGKKNLKYWWVMGVLDLACSYGSLGWTQDDISKFKQYVVKTNLSQSARSFLSKSEWDRAMREGGFVKKMLKLDLKRIGQSVFDSGGGRKR